MLRTFWVWCVALHTAAVAPSNADCHCRRDVRAVVETMGLFLSRGLGNSPVVLCVPGSKLFLVYRIPGLASRFEEEPDYQHGGSSSLSVRSANSSSIDSRGSLTISLDRVLSQFRDQFTVSLSGVSRIFISSL
jgi:hypothetical protein